MSTPGAEWYIVYAQDILDRGGARPYFLVTLCPTEEIARVVAQHEAMDWPGLTWRMREVTLGESMLVPELPTFAPGRPESHSKTREDTHG